MVIIGTLKCDDEIFRGRIWRGVTPTFIQIMSDENTLLAYVAFKTHCFFVIVFSHIEDSMTSSTVKVPTPIEVSTFLTQCVVVLVM